MQHPDIDLYKRYIVYWISFNIPSFYPKDHKYINSFKNKLDRFWSN